MNRILLTLKRPFIWLYRFRHRCGYGVHSPFAFNLITHVIYESTAYYKYEELAKAQKQRELEIRISTLEACDPKEIMSEELRSKVKALLNSMPEKTRIAFISDRLDGKSHKEIAEELGISVKGVEYHISKAVKLLRDNLKEYAPSLIFII